MSTPAPTADTQTQPPLRGLGHALLGTLILAGASTAAEAAWAIFGIRHTVTAGLIHGALIFMVAGAVLGAARDPEKAAERSPILGAVLGALGGIIAGLSGAAVYYLLVRPLHSAGIGGGMAVFPAYFSVWLILGLILKVLGGVEISVGAALRRGAMAGLIAALGFYFVAVLWSGYASPPLVYLLFFGAWATAFLPGFLALLLRRPPRL